MVTAVILAAGAGNRMGVPKQLLPLGGQAMIRWVAGVACQSAVQDVVVVTGAHHKAVAEALQNLSVRLVHNADWAAGQAGSVKVGIKAALQYNSIAALFLLADQPLITVELIDQLLATYYAGKGSIIMPVYQGRRGNPVLFDLVQWHDELLALRGDQGARQIIFEHPEEVASVSSNCEEIFWDVDTPDDYDRMQKLWTHQFSKANS
jgi:molybdenum cofactor cytidylyltransferase